MHIDRELQALVLHHLKKLYPGSGLDNAFWADLYALAKDGDRANLVANIIYLEEHGLLESGLVPKDSGGYHFSRSGMRITAKGLDFLEDDGGLSAVLSCVTVRLHDETLACLERFLAQSPLPEQEKRRYIRRLRELPFEATKHAICTLLDMALEQVPDALQQVQNLLS